MSMTKSQKPTEVTRKWYVVDASSTTLGRLSTEVAKLLTGKHKATYTPHVDGGDYVVVVNAAKLNITGQKRDSKKYYRHSGHAGALKQRTLGEQIELDPTEVIHKSVRGMISDNKLRDGRLARLKVYSDENHNHEAQKPEVREIK